jgi:gliding motility-associatede transport system auxiliary component
MRILAKLQAWLCSVRVRVAANVWLQSVLALALVVLVNAILGMTPQTQAWKIDCTQAGRHSISPKTESYLKALEQPIVITIIQREGMARYGRGKDDTIYLSDRVGDTLGLYDAASDMVRVRIMDADRQKTELKEIEKEIKDTLLPDSVLLRCGDRHEMVSFAAMVKPPLDPNAVGVAGEVQFQIEERITAALMKVAEGKPSIAYFLTGHGELSLVGSEQNGMNHLAAALRRENYTLESLSLRQSQAVPDSCDVLVIAGLRAELEAEEVRAIEAYLHKGGSLFVLALPAHAGGRTGSLTRILNKYDIRIRDEARVIEVYGTAIPGRPRYSLAVEAQSFGHHPVAEGMRTLALYIENACPLTRISDLTTGRGGPGISPLRARFTVTPLAMSSDGSWAETKLHPKPEYGRDANDLQGPCVVAMSIEPRQRGSNSNVVGPRLVVATSPTMVMDVPMKKFLGNRVFAVNAMNWLAQREYKLGIPPQNSDNRKLILTPARTSVIFYITIVIMPLAAALFGAGVFWWRRRF